MKSVHVLVIIVNIDNIHGEKLKKIISCFTYGAKMGILNGLGCVSIECRSASFFWGFYEYLSVPWIGYQPVAGWV